jgi:hypothetical protein
MNPSLNWKYLPDAIAEAEIELKLTGPKLTKKKAKA